MSAATVPGRMASAASRTSSLPRSPELAPAKYENPPLSDSGFSYFAGASSGLLGNDDVREAAEAMRPGTVAALIVYENTWAAPFVSAVRRSGGELVASVRIPAADVIEALDALEQTD